MSPSVEQLGAGRPRLVVLEGVEVTTPLDPYLDTQALAEYAGCSARWLRGKRADPLHPLPHYRIGGKVLHRRSEFDAWIARYHQTSPNPDVRRAVAEMLRSFPGA